MAPVERQELWVNDGGGGGGRDIPILGHGGHKSAETPLSHWAVTTGLGNLEVPERGQGWTTQRQG